MNDLEPPISFDEAINEAQSFGSRAVLLGNGFSIAQVGKKLAYSNLLEVSGIDENHSLKNVFDKFDTYDFEKVIRYLEITDRVARSYGQIGKYQTDAKEVRQKLIEAIQKVHPSEFRDIPEHEINSCVCFLKNFGKVFTLNYDLLLYWVSICSQAFQDGFLKSENIGRFRGPFDMSAECSIYNIHGGLHLFLSPDRNVYKAIANSGDNLLDSITKIIRDENCLPLYVAEGTSEQKLGKIRSVPYLNYCLEELQGLSGALFVFGHSGDSNDEHIYDAIFKSEIEALYFCIYDQGQHPNVGGLLERYRLDRWNRCNKNTIIKFVDASPGQMNIWGKP